jgi:hypothetical protein
MKIPPCLERLPDLMLFLFALLGAVSLGMSFHQPRVSENSRALLYLQGKTDGLRCSIAILQHDGKNERMYCDSDKPVLPKKVTMGDL